MLWADRLGCDFKVRPYGLWPETCSLVRLLLRTAHLAKSEAANELSACPGLPSAVKTSTLAKNALA